MTRFIIKSKAYGDQVVTIDPVDAYLLRMHVWHIKRCSDGLYVYRNVRGVPLALHRHLADAVQGEGVRFANSNTLDLRRSNLIRASMDDTMRAIMAGARATKALIRITAQ